MASNLYNRLKVIKEQNNTHLRSRTTKPLVKNVMQDPISLKSEDKGIWLWTKPYEGVWKATIELALDIDCNLLKIGLSSLFPGASLDNTLWFDTETTGLSGGAGTIIFLIGFVQIKDHSVECTQLFLQDYPYEPEFIGAIKEQIENTKYLVSYNGKTFDMPLLKSRIIMTGNWLDLPEAADILHPVRRMWKSILSRCNLGTIETEVLGIFRIQDVDSAEIPSIYQQFLKNGYDYPNQFSPMIPVLSHHLTDLLSMVLISEVFGKIINILFSTEVKPEDLMGLQRSYKCSPIGLLQLAVANNRSRVTGNDFTVWFQYSDFIDEIDRSVYLYKLGMICLGEVKWELAEKCFIKNVEMDQSIRSLLRLCIYWEHRSKDPQKVLNIVHNWYPRCREKNYSNLNDKDQQNAQWEKRIQRLKRKTSVLNQE